MAKVPTLTVRVRGIALFNAFDKPRKFDDNEVPKYETSVKLTPEEYDRLNDICEKFAIEHLGEKKARRAPLPVYTADPKKDKDETPYFKCSSKNQPQCFGPDGKEMKPGDIFDGAEVIVLAAIWAQDNTYGTRINAFLNGVKWTGGGTKIEGRKQLTANDFDEDNETDTNFEVDDETPF